MMKNLFSFPAFIISFLIGLIFVYLSDKPGKVIHVYPTPDNIHRFEYIDKADNCFEYHAHEVQCPNDINKINLIPIQY
tara:strand:- start:13050 stop:13283 length:234 start_codon:yes stop_codon:yes gene_type:complete